MSSRSLITPRQMMSGHTDNVRGVVHLANGQRIITCSLDGSLRLWDLKSGVQIGDKWRDQVVVVGVKGVDVIEGMVEGVEVSEGLEEVEGGEWNNGAAPVKGVLTISLSPNGTTVASGGRDGTVALWDVETGKVITKWTEHIGDVLSVCWSPDGERVLSGSEDGTARVRDVKNGETILTIRTGGKAVDEDEDWDVNVDVDWDVDVDVDVDEDEDVDWDVDWDVDVDVDWDEDVDVDVDEYVCAVIYSPDSSKIATGGWYIKIWDAKTGELLAILKHNFMVMSLAWTSDGNKFISASYGPIRIFDTTTWEQIATLDGHPDWVNAITLFRNDCLLASTSVDKTARLWNLDTNLPVGPPLQHKDQLRCAAFSADGKVLVTGGEEKNAYMWDVYAILQEAGLQDLLSIPNVPAVRSSMDTDATQDDQLPPDFFNDAQDGVDGVRSRPSRRPRRRFLVPSFGSPTALLARLSSLFRRPQINPGGATELQQRPRRTIFSRRDPPRVDVAAVRDRQALYVARRPERDKPKPASQQPQPQPQASTSQTPAASTSTMPPEFMDTDATQDDQLPPDFFNDAQDRVDSSMQGVRFHPSRRPRRHDLVPSLGSPTALLAGLSSLFHRSQINAGAATELQQYPRRTILSRHGPPRVEVSAVRDKQSLFVAKRDKPTPAHQPQHQPQASTSQTPAASPSTTPPAPAPSIATPGAATAQPRRHPWWAPLVLFICCASPPDAHRPQPQASTSQTPAASTSTMPPAPAPAPATSIVTPSAAIAQPRRPIPLRARLVLFICCSSPPDTNGH